MKKYVYRGIDYIGKSIFVTLFGFKVQYFRDKGESTGSHYKSISICKVDRWGLNSRELFKFGFKRKGLRIKLF